MFIFLSFSLSPEGAYHRRGYLGHGPGQTVAAITLLFVHVHNATPIITFRSTDESAFLPHDHDLGSGFENYVPIPIDMIAGLLG